MVGRCCCCWFCHFISCLLCFLLGFLSDQWVAVRPGHLTTSLLSLYLTMTVVQWIYAEHVCMNVGQLCRSGCVLYSPRLLMRSESTARWGSNEWCVPESEQQKMRL